MDHKGHRLISRDVDHLVQPKSGKDLPDDYLKFLGRTHYWVPIKKGEWHRPGPLIREEHERTIEHGLGGGDYKEYLTEDCRPL